MNDGRRDQLGQVGSDGREEGPSLLINDGPRDQLGQVGSDGRADDPVRYAADGRGRSPSTRWWMGGGINSSVCHQLGAVLSFDKMVENGIDPSYAYAD